MQDNNKLSKWVPLAVALFGMVFYTAMTRGLALPAADLLADPAFQAAPSATGQAAASIHFRSASVLSIISAFASVTVSVALIAAYLDRASAKFHLFVMCAVVLMAVYLNALAPSSITAQLDRIACSNLAAKPSAIAFCAGATGIAPNDLPRFLPSSEFYKILNLPLAAAAACIGYAAFALSADGRVKGKVAASAIERAIVLVIGCGAATLVFSVLTAREFARWAFSGITHSKDSLALIDGLTFCNGATSSALLAMIWLIAFGIFAFRTSRQASTEAGGILSKSSAAYAIISILAPILLAIVQHLF